MVRINNKDYNRHARPGGYVTEECYDGLVRKARSANKEHARWQKGIVLEADYKARLAEYRGWLCLPTFFTYPVVEVRFAVASTVCVIMPGIAETVKFPELDILGRSTQIDIGNCTMSIHLSPINPAMPSGKYVRLHCYQRLKETPRGGDCASLRINTEPRVGVTLTFALPGSG